MIDNINEVKAAKAKIVEGSLTIWNARLDSYLKSGDTNSAINHLKSPVEFGDDCSCNKSCQPGVLSQLGIGEQSAK